MRNFHFNQQNNSKEMETSLTTSAVYVKLHEEDLSVSLLGEL